MSFSGGGSGSGGSIAGASDSSLSNPGAGESLVYDTSIQKWKNSALTKSSVGLGSVDNTSDLNKPVSTAMQTALTAKANQATTYTKVEVDAARAATAQVSPLYVYALDQTSWPTKASVIAGLGLSQWTGVTVFDSVKYPNHPAPTEQQAWDRWHRRSA